MPRRRHLAVRHADRQICATSPACTTGSQRRPASDSTTDPCADRRASNRRPSPCRTGCRARRRSARRTQRRGHRPRHRRPHRLRSQVRLEGPLGVGAALRTPRNRAGEPQAHRARPPSDATMPSPWLDVGWAVGAVGSTPAQDARTAQGLPGRRTSRTPRTSRTRRRRAVRYHLAHPLETGAAVAASSSARHRSTGRRRMTQHVRGRRRGPSAPSRRGPTRRSRWQFEHRSPARHRTGRS